MPNPLTHIERSQRGEIYERLLRPDVDAERKSIQAEIDLCKLEIRQLEARLRSLDWKPA